MSRDSSTPFIMREPGMELTPQPVHIDGRAATNDWAVRNGTTTTTTTQNALPNGVNPSSGPSASTQAAPSNGQTPPNGAATRSVALDEELGEEQSHEDEGPDEESPRWVSNYARKDTVLDTENIESRAFRHLYIFRRPNALQYYHPELNPFPSTVSRTSTHDTSSSSKSSGIGRQRRSAGDYIKQLGRLELFVDLIWVGIIANLSGTYGEQAFTDSGITAGQALGQFVLIFLPIWKIWDCLRDYCTNYYQDDFLQRNFVVWILILSVLFGVNAPYAYRPNDEKTSLTLTIGLYLVIRASFLVQAFVQASYSPFLKRKFYFSHITTLFTGAFWIGAIFAPYPARLALLIVANFLEQPIYFFLSSPAGDKLVTGGWIRHQHIEHYIDRHEGFFIIILGEGVFRLIEGSPSGWGINRKTGTVLEAVLMYYILHWLYFNGDQAKSYVHATRRTWWRPALWKHFHIVLYGSLLCLAASVLFLVESEHQDLMVNTGDPDTSSHLHERRLTTDTELVGFATALWSASTALSLALAEMTFIALLNRPLDKPNTLVVNNRWLRMAPRVPAIAAIMCLPLFPNMTGEGWCGGAVATIYIIFIWETIAGLEKGWQWFEPEKKEK